MSQVDRGNILSRIHVSLSFSIIFAFSIPLHLFTSLLLYCALPLHLLTTLLLLFLPFQFAPAFDNFKKGMVGETKLLAYHLEDLTKAKNRTDGVKQIEWSIAGKLSSTREYQWYIVYRPLLLKMASLICMFLSLFSLLGVICSMDGVTPAVSIYFHAVHDGEASATGIAIFVLLSLGYTTYVTLWSLFQIRSVKTLKME